MLVFSCIFFVDLLCVDEFVWLDKDLFFVFEKMFEIGLEWLDWYEDISEVEYVIYF